MAKPTPGKQYTIQDENTLSQVARRAYGNAAHWPIIHRANQSTLRSDNPDLIYPGEVIFIPELAELLRDTPSISNREPDELSIVFDGLEIRSSAARVTLTMDTPADGFSLTFPWTPGANPELDKRTLQDSYTPVKVYIGGELVLSGYLYDVAPSTDERGTVKDLVGFSRTIDLVDSAMRPPYEESNVTLKQRAQKLVAPHGIKAIFETDTGGPFDRVNGSETVKIIGHLNSLALQRGVLISSTADGNLLFHLADIESAPVATLEEGQPPTGKFAARFNGRKRFNIYRAVNSTPFGNTNQEVQDKSVPRSRFTTIRIQDTLGGEIETAAIWARNRTTADALSIPIPVAGWLNPRTGRRWKSNTKVTVISPTLSVPDGFDFLIRSIEFEERENEKSCILNIVPPQVYTKEEIIEPWKV